MFGLQFYLLIGTKRWGVHIAPFAWHLGFTADSTAACVMVGPFLFTSEEGVH